METSRDKAVEYEGATSIRLRYSRQFQSGGHAHTIDAEATLAVGISADRREQVIRELEADVEQLARQIVQHGARPAGETHPQMPTLPGATASRSTEPPARPGTATRATEPPTPAPVLPRPAANAAPSTAPLPVSESMPAMPTTSGERMVTLPNFINLIKKYWDMSPEEAMDLLGVHELTGLNLREALYTLRSIKEPENSANPGSIPGRARTTQQPTTERPQQAARETLTTSNSRPPSTAPTAHPPNGPTASMNQPVFAVVSEPRHAPSEREHEPLPDFAGSSKAPLPVQIGVVRDISARAYSFEEEDEEDYPLPVTEEESEHRQAAESKLEELKEIRGGNAASPERLNVLNNVLDSQVDEKQLEQLIKRIWGVANKKRLKVQQVEALISWAKEDYFVDEVESLLATEAEEDE